MRTLLYPLIFVSLAVRAQTPTVHSNKESPLKVSPAAIVKRVQPDYSPEARAANYEGTLTVYLEVDTSGKPQAVQVIQGLGLGLDEKAIEAVAHWEFKPAELNGSPVNTAQAIEIPFSLDPAVSWRIRHTAYIVNRGSNNDVVIDKPVLTEYTRPDLAACVAQNRSLIAVNFKLDKKGVPSGIEVSPRSTSATVQEVLNAVKQWRFQPALSEGKPVNAKATFTLECGPDSPAEVSSITQTGPGLTEPSVLSRVEPEYLKSARAAKVQGSVIIDLLVDTDGFAINLRTNRMLGSGLDAKAMEAVKQWRFNPALRNGKPVTVEVKMEIAFRLL